MSLYKIQGKAEKRKGIYYEFDSEDVPLGEGGMGKVYKGRCVDEHTGSARNVAIKFMYSDLPPYAIEKARREAAIQFRHDNLIEMLGFIETEEKGVLGDVFHRYHVVSELLEGVSLDSLFEGRLTDQQGHFVPFAEKMFKDYKQDVNHFAVELVKNILSGLMAMHDAGYIHRDIDPTNIMITTDGRVKLIDFGIAKKFTSLTAHDKHLTQAGQFVGKPEYAAPELVLGAIDEQNATTDLYAVGILLFQCIVGHPPFEGDRSDILQKQLHSPLPLRLVKHRGIRKIIAQATEKSRAKRFQSAAEFRVALDHLDLSKGNGFEWKPLYTYVAGAAAVFALVALIVPMIPKPGPSPAGSGGATATLSSAKSGGTGRGANGGVTYASALAMLKEPLTSKEGLSEMQQLSNEGDADASYLLSRLYFKSLLDDDYSPDSIRTIQQTIHLAADNGRAHRLLQTAVSQNPKNYQALYELACDYWGAKERTEAVPRRDGDAAIRYYTQAMTYAREAGDAFYVKMIEGYLADCQRWKALTGGN